MRRLRRLAPWLLPLLLLGLLVAGPAQAARQFNGTSDYLNSASTIDLSAYQTIAISFWLWWDTFANDDKMALETTVVAGYITVDPNQAAGIFIVQSANNATVTSNMTRPSAAAWHHYVINIDYTKSSQEIDTIYVDGVSQSLTWPDNGNNTLTFANLTWYIMSRGGTTFFGAGRFAELAIWGGIILTQGNATSLYNGGNGTCASNVQGGSLVGYWQILGTASPEPPTVGAINLTVNGATSVAHPATIVCGAGAAAAPSAHAPKGQRVPRYPPRGR